MHPLLLHPLLLLPPPPPPIIFPPTSLLPPFKPIPSPSFAYTKIFTSISGLCICKVNGPLLHLLLLPSLPPHSSFLLDRRVEEGAFPLPSSSFPPLTPGTTEEERGRSFKFDDNLTGNLEMEFIEGRDTLIVTTVKGVVHGFPIEEINGEGAGRVLCILNTKGSFVLSLHKISSSLETPDVLLLVASMSRSILSLFTLILPSSSFPPLSSLPPPLLSPNSEISLTLSGLVKRFLGFDQNSEEIASIRLDGGIICIVNGNHVLLVISIHQKTVLTTYQLQSSSASLHLSLLPKSLSSSQKKSYLSLLLLSSCSHPLPPSLPSSSYPPPSSSSSPPPSSLPPSSLELLTLTFFSRRELEGWEEVGSREEWEGVKVEGNVILQGRGGVASLISEGVLEERSWIDWGGMRRKVEEDGWEEKGRKEEEKREKGMREEVVKRNGRSDEEEESKRRDRGIGGWEKVYVGGEEEAIVVGGVKGVGIVWRGDEKEGKILEIKEERKEGGRRKGEEEEGFMRVGREVFRMMELDSVGFYKEFAGKTQKLGYGAFLKKMVRVKAFKLRGVRRFAEDAEKIIEFVKSFCSDLISLLLNESEFLIFPPIPSPSSYSYRFLSQRIIEKVGLYSELLFVSGNLLEILEIIHDNGDKVFSSELINELETGRSLLLPLLQFFQGSYPGLLAMAPSQLDSLMSWLVADFGKKFEFRRGGILLEGMLNLSFKRLLCFYNTPEDSMPTILEFCKRSSNFQLARTLIDLFKLRNPDIEFLKVISMLNLHDDKDLENSFGYLCSFVGIKSKLPWKTSVSSDLFKNLLQTFQSDPKAKVIIAKAALKSSRALIMERSTLRIYLKIWMDDCLEREDLEGAILAWKEEGRRKEEAMIGEGSRREEEGWRREEGREEEGWVERVWWMGRIGELMNMVMEDFKSILLRKATDQIEEVAFSLNSKTTQDDAKGPDYILLLYQFLTTKGQFAEAGYLLSRLLSVLLRHCSGREVGEGVLRTQLFLVDSILFAFKQAAHPPIHPTYPTLHLSKEEDEEEMREKEGRRRGDEEREEEEEEEGRDEEERGKNEGRRRGGEEEWEEEDGRTFDDRKIREKKWKRREDEEGGILITYSSLVSLKSRLEMIIFLREKEEERKGDEGRRRRNENEGRREERELSLSTSDLTLFKKGLQLGELDRVLQFIREQGIKIDGRKELLLSLVEVIWREEDEDDAKAFLKLMESLMGGKEGREEGRKLEEEGRKLEEEGSKLKEERRMKKEEEEEEDGDKREDVREAGELAWVKGVEGEKWVFERLEAWLKRNDEVGYLKLMCKFNQTEKAAKYLITLLNRMKVASNARFANFESPIHLPAYLPVEVVLTVYNKVKQEGSRYQKEIEKLLA